MADLEAHEVPGDGNDKGKLQPLINKVKAAIRKGSFKKNKGQRLKETAKKPNKRKGLAEMDNADEEKDLGPTRAQVVHDDDAVQLDSKKAKKPKNPFKIPPHAYTEDIFQICQPFVTVAFSDDMSLDCEQDKVLDGKNMDNEALDAAIANMCDGYIISSRCTKSRSQEMGIRDLHVSLAKGFWMLTQPRSKPKVSKKVALRGTENKGRVQGPEVVQQGMQTKKLAEGPEVVQQGMQMKELAEGPEEVEGLEVVMGKEEEDTLGDADKPSSTESLDCLFEGDEGEKRANKTSSQFDISFRVTDRRIQGIDKNVIVLVVECKYGSLSLDNIFQVAAYTCTLAKGNMTKGRYEPVYMEVWNEGFWRYAIFYPEGLVEIEDSQIKDTARESTPIEELEGRLCTSTLSLSSKYAVSKYPDGVYVHGLLYISMKKFLLPNPMMPGGGMLYDAKLFYQSKLRIIVGDKVLCWSVDDVEAAAQRRTKQVKEEKLLFLSGSTALSRVA